MSNIKTWISFQFLKEFTQVLRLHRSSNEVLSSISSSSLFITWKAAFNLIDLQLMSARLVWKLAASSISSPGIKIQVPRLIKSLHRSPKRASKGRYRGKHHVRKYITSAFVAWYIVQYPGVRNDYEFGSNVYRASHIIIRRHTMIMMTGHGASASNTARVHGRENIWRIRYPDSRGRLIYRHLEGVSGITIRTYNVVLSYITRGEHHDNDNKGQACNLKTSKIIMMIYFSNVFDVFTMSDRLLGQKGNNVKITYLLINR